jgi:hypothetical protein
VNEQEHGASQVGHLSRSAERYTIGLLTTGNFTRFAPGHWLGVIDAAREQETGCECGLLSG